MINQRQTERLIEKVSRMEKIYADFLISDREEVTFGIYEPQETRYAPPAPGDYRPIARGAHWGRPFSYAWFGAEIAVPARMRGKRVYLECDTGAFESLAYLNGRPYGMFDYVAGRSERLHRYLPLEDGADRMRFDIESYASHRYNGTQPYETPVTFGKETFAPEDREYNGFWLVTFDETIERVLDDLYMLNSLYRSAGENTFLRAELEELYERIYSYIDLMPSEGLDRQSLSAACEEIERTIYKNKDTAEDGYRAGLVGHSHLDTAWLWPVEETKRKAARTASTAVRLLKRYPHYRFIMSSAVYMDWFKRYYPALFEDVKSLVAEGRFEPNGAVWVECDCNLTGGEAMVRQFMYGQRFLRKELGYEADSFWLPDTFGYSAALPQIMQKAHVKYFYTTKLSWNDTNRFPYDSFVWEGIDGSRVVAHFNSTHSFADPQKIVERVGGAIMNKRLSDKTLIAYGFGDGGGGPSEKMVEYALKSENVRGIPAAKHVSISQFMRDLRKDNLPTYAGELYLELHRGTLTSMSMLKYSNRKLENALHDLEFIAAAGGKQDAAAQIEQLYKVLLLNQFHDILPGTSMNEVNVKAIEENLAALHTAKETAAAMLPVSGQGESVTLVNTLGFARKGFASIEGAYSFENAESYIYKDIDGREQTCVRAEAEAFSSVVLRRAKGKKKASPSVFVREGNRLLTPDLEVEFDENMFLTRLYDRAPKREAAYGKLNELILHRDVPCAWDNWDIDADYAMKGKVCRLLHSETVVDNAYEYRIRSEYAVGEGSKLVQDMIFRAGERSVDFRSKIDWHEKHSLLKAHFAANIFSRTMKNEIQFGYLERSLLRNTSEQQAKFEVCNHKWTDISENNYGFAIINDCKYGVGGRPGKLSLSLMKGGTHPDSSADEGVRYFGYKVLLHEGAFSCESVVKPAYEYNNPFFFVDGAAPVASFLRCGASGVIAETVKPAEDGDGYVVRLYESEGNHVSAPLAFGRKYSIQECDLLEDEEKNLGEADSLELAFRPFEIKTLKLLPM